MRDIKNKLTSSKNTKNIQSRKGKSFGYQVLGFGAGGGIPRAPYDINFLVIAGGAAGTPGGGNNTQGGGGGAGGFRTATETEVALDTVITMVIGAGGASSTANNYATGNNGVASQFSGSGLTTISSAGGGSGGANGVLGLAGGCGGGGGAPSAGGPAAPSAPGAGNTPSTSPAQGLSLIHIWTLPTNREV